MHEALFQWVAVGLFVTGMLMSAVYRSRAERFGGRLPVAEEGAGWRLVRHAMGLTGLSVFGVALLAPDWAPWMRLALPDMARWLGAGLVLLTLPWMLWTLRHLGLNITKTALVREGATLVTDGPYRLVRHPLYTGGFVSVFGFGLLLGNWAVLLMAVIALLFVVERSDLEEQNLVNRFGEAYQSYQLTTGRLVPRSARHLKSAVRVR